MLEYDLVNSITYRLITQSAILIMSLIAWQMVFDERKENSKPFYIYMNYSFSLLLVQSIFMFVVLWSSFLFEKQLPELFMPIIDHLLKVYSTMYLAAAFLSTFSNSVVLPKRFITTGQVLTVIFLPLIWYQWYLFQLDYPGRGFAYFGGDLFVELTVTLLAGTCLYFVVSSTIKNKGGFIMAALTLLAKELLHTYNILIANNTVPWILLIERFLPVIFFSFITVSVHREILTKLRKTTTERDLIREKMNQETIEALVSSLAAKDQYTKGHSERVTDYALLIAKEMGFSKTESEKLYYAALLHDLGKIGITETVLNSPTNLDSHQSDLIKKHPEIGAQILSKIQPLRDIVPAVMHHHERYDGTGYPGQLRGDQIPLHARIIALADAVDAMASNRTYRSALASEEILAELRKSSGTQFDPKLVDILLNNLAPFQQSLIGK